MSKYILKKKYPGSPEVGAEIIRTRIMGLTKPRVLETYMIKGQDTFSIKNPQDYPEFWEKVVEKNYEILKVKNKQSTQILDVISGQLICDEYSIYSVKRLIDNTIWTIGDRITGKSDYNCIIHSIELNPDYPQIMFNRLDEGIDLINAKHIKEPIYKTEDNKEIYEGDKVHWVNTNNYTHLYSLPFSTGALKLLNNVGSIYKVFSTKELADEWINLEKPYLSNKDVLNELKKTNDIEQLKKIFTNKFAK